MNNPDKVASPYYKVLIVIIALFIISPFPEPVGATTTPMMVSVSIAPQVYFLNRIGGERVQVNLLLPPGKSPATYSPTPRQIIRLAKSHLFFRIGVPFETIALPKIKNIAKHLIIIDTRKGLTLREMEESGHGHDHEAEEHGHGRKDPHIWLSPTLVKQQAQTIYDALIRADPAGTPTYSKNFNGFLQDLDQLHLELQKLLRPVEGKTLMVFHPSYGYFTDAYGLHQLAVEIEGKSPKGRDLIRIIKTAKRETLNVIFVQPQFDQHAARKIARAINGRVIPLNPITSDYLQDMKSMGESIADALSPNKSL